MKHLKLFFACLLMAVLSIGQMWAADPVASQAPANGKSYVVAAYVSSKYYALPNTTSNGSTLTGVEVTLDSDGKVSAEDAEGKTWTLTEGSTSGQFLFSYTSGTNTYYLYKNGTGKTNYNFKVSTGNQNYWTFTANGTGYTVAAYDRGTNNVNIQCDNGTFKCYSTASAIILLPIASDDPEPACTNTVTITKGAETNGTYTLSATEVCGDDDGEDVTISDITPAPGYEFDEITTSVSGTVDNDLKKVTGITAATTITVKFKTLPTYTVSFNTGEGNPTVGSETETIGGAGITLPAGPEPTCSSDGWEFAGWAASAVASQTTDAPTLLSGTYHPTGNVTLYAVYKKTEGGGSGAAVGTTMWSENFTGAGNKTTPTSPTTNGSEVYGSATVTYIWTDGGTTSQVYLDTSGPHTDANNDNALISKSSGNLTINGIPTGNASTLTLSYAIAGQGSIAPSTSTANVSIDGNTITIEDSGVTTFDLIFTNSHSSKNGRLDDIVVIVATTSSAGTTYYLSAPTCSAPTCTNLDAPTVSVPAADLTYNSAKLTWVSVENAVKYIVKFDGVDHETTDAFYEATGLAANTDYTYQVKSVAAGGQSDWCDSEFSAEASLKTKTAPEVQLWLVKKQGDDAVNGGTHTLGVEFNLTPSDLACDKEFVGWTTADYKDYTHATDAPAVLLNKYTFTSNEAVTLYAVYGTPGASTYVATTFAEIPSGSEVVITGNNGDMYAMSSDKGASAAPTAVAISETATAGVLDVEGKSNIFWVLSKDGNNFSFTKVGSEDKLYCTGDNNGVRVGSGANNVFSMSSNYMFNNGASAYVGIYNSADWRRYGTINSNIQNQTFAFYKKNTIYSNYATTCALALADPEFTPAAGVYTEAKNIVITAEEGTIYYTLDGTDPTSSSDEYTAPIILDANGTTTIKAIAISATSQSAIVSATYTINLPLSTIPAIFEAATGTQTEVNIKMGNWVVSGVGTDEKTVYVTDNTNGFIIYNSSHGFEVGDILSGTITCDLKKYKGAAELIGVTTSTTGLTVTKGGTVTPASVAPADLTGVNTGALITLSSWQFDGSDLTNGATYIQPFTTLYDCSSSFTTNNYYNVSGIYLQFDSKKEILPRSAADIEEVSLSDPEISYSPASATIELGQSLPGTVFANPHDLAISYNSNNEAVATVSNTGVIALGTATGTAVITASFAGDATYAAGNATYTITVNPASVSENVVILAVYDTKYYAMSTNNASSAFTAIEVEYDGSLVTVASAADKAAIQWTKKTSGDNTTFQDADSKYMKSADGTSMSLQDAVCNWVWDATGEYYKISGTTRTFFYQNGTGFKNFATSNFNKTGYSGKASVIVIDPANIVVSSKVSAELAYDPTSNEITQGDAWSAPTLVNPHSVTITSYASDNESVATVEGGVIALAGGIGTAHITAHFDGDASYLEGDAVYTITVNAPAPTPTGTTYTKVTSTSDITDGEYLIVYEDENVAFNGNLTTLDAANNTVSVVISGDEIAGTTEIDAAVFTIDVANGTLRAHMGDYIGVTSYGNGLKQNANAETYPAHSFSIDGEGNAVISLNNSWTAAMVLNYNKGAGDKRFRYYKSASPQQSIQLYKKETVTPPTADYTRAVTSGNYGTICLPKAGTISGAKLFEVAYFDGSMIYVDEILSGAMAAGVPYIFQATSTQLNVTYNDNTDAPVEASHVNGLYGFYNLSNMATDNADKLDLDEDQGNYILYQNQYWLVSGRAAFINNFRAYIKLGEISTTEPAPNNNGAPRRRVAMGVNGTNVATGFENLNASEKPVKLMIDGNIFILRGEKLYDATGRLVK